MNLPNKAKCIQDTMGWAEDKHFYSERENEKEGGILVKNITRKSSIKSHFSNFCCYKTYFMYVIGAILRS